MLNGKKILIGVCGGIASYKICSLVRELIKRKAEVKIIMTDAATKFVAPLTFSTLSGNEVYIDLFPKDNSTGTSNSVEHIKLSLWADVFVIAPATANTIAKANYGFADNLLTSVILASRAPIIFVPSMDVDMFENKTTQENIHSLESKGYFILQPESGFLASGLSGKGRLPEISKIVSEIEFVVNKNSQDLSNKNILITAGPTQEAIDPVRYISNRSSGKMGYALAKAAMLRGANVTLISGPTNLVAPSRIKSIQVKNSKEMFEAVKSESEKQDVIIMSAAVADYTPLNSSKKKIKKGTEKNITLELTKTDDILKFLGETKKNQTLIGFAIETDNEIENAKKKLIDKNLDFIILNNPLTKDAGFEVETNIVSIIYKDGIIEDLPKMTKEELAHEIFDRIK